MDPEDAEAELKDRNGNVIGSHSAGPTWKLQDGSEVSGKALAHVDSPDPASIPWLLVNVVNHSGKGALIDADLIPPILLRWPLPASLLRRFPAYCSRERLEGNTVLAARHSL
jgi:hypothetical protein